MQDISSCTGPLPALNALNSVGRSKISSLRKSIDRFSDVAKDIKDNELLKELALQKEQLASTMDTFKKVNLKAMLFIENAAKEELLRPTKPTELRQRQVNARDKASLAKTSSNVTDQLLNISRTLAETTQRSALTLDTLTASSDNVLGTEEELKVTSGAIGQSGKLLAKYGRREFTDKVLVFFAFIFFLACVLYIMQKRLF
ncbi:unnamed protein product [Acanthoscelides obtectus]|uniref:Sec20 C-terminal domain-containing protein n=1 Tax=Acanthoscelides obtectus TaxID=200917 RepID=A0A9P0LQ64_ACAOB|nr:unnamed protein product [Acanthoscelides obtectus]CAK1621712.1 Vesicle transport protein SEC20 [Acanthoscelides obtectus]